MTAQRLRSVLATRPVILGGGVLLSLLVAALLGYWLAQANAPLTRHGVAQGLLENGAPDQAAHLFEAPIWQGVALYRAGRYHRAVGAFVTDDSVTGLYNMGNAYARLGLYRGAATAYEAVLRRQPTHDDARHNLELVLRAERRARELEEESRETESAGSWEDGLYEDEQEAQQRSPDSEPTASAEDSDDEMTAEGESGEQQSPTEAADPTMSDADQATEGMGGSEQQSEQTDASIFSLSGSEQEDADDLAPNGEAPENTEVLGGVVDRAREEAMADEIVLRRIVDDPAGVLRARLNMSLRRQRAGR